MTHLIFTLRDANNTHPISSALGASQVEVEELNEGAWTDGEQDKLTQALAKYLNDKALDTKARWKAIADDVGSRGAKECAVRFKEVKVKSSQRSQAKRSQARVPTRTPQMERLLPTSQKERRARAQSHSHALGGGSV